MPKGKGYNGKSGMKKRGTGTKPMMNGKGKSGKTGMSKKGKTGMSKKGKK